ncbi:MAG: hypothetical protein HWD61_10945 [Parachlamydiaceae bacterium]|nr:MAG: hypothetical protein HWD61_10945 [Parachlamydiaceae bacterium]
MSKVSLEVPGKSSKQCYDRWINHVDPSLDKSPWTNKEISIIKQHGKDGKWVQLSKTLQEQFPNKTTHRAPNDLKNYWYSNFEKVS